MKMLQRRRKMVGLALVVVLFLGTIVALAPFTGGDGGEAEIFAGVAPPVPQPPPAAQLEAALAAAARPAGTLLEEVESARPGVPRLQSTTIASLHLTAPPPSRAGTATWTVSPTDPTADFESIQAAIGDARVKSGDTIEVWPGTYYELIEVYKQLNIYAHDGPDATIINASGWGSAVTITADGCSIRGFTVTGGGRTPVRRAFWLLRIATISRRISAWRTASKGYAW